MTKKSITPLLPVLLIVILSLACGSVQVGVVTPTSENDFTPIDIAQEPTLEVVTAIDDEIPPTAEPIQEPAEDFSYLWVEYWNPVFDYGLAIPSHWRVETESEGGFMMLWSYEQEFFQANSIKGWWIGGDPPEGAVKLDFVPFEDIVPEQSLATAISNILEDPMMTVVLSVEEIALGDFEAVRITTARPDDLEDTTSNVAIRLSPEVILYVAAYPSSAHESSDVQTILSTLVPNKSTPIIKPTIAPHPPLTVNSAITESPTFTYATAWYGHIASLPEGEFYDDKVVLLPLGTGDFGIEGTNPEIDDQIRSLRDASSPNEYVHLWGVLYCNVDDYNTCRLSVERLEYGDQYTGGYGPVEDWVGRIKATTYNDEAAYAFELAEGLPIWYGISANNDPLLQSRIEALSDTDTLVTIWGDLFVGVQDVNGTRIEIREIDPPEPGMMPSPTSCDSESGYLGAVEETIELIQYNLQTGNYYPIAYTLGNPFVMGFWRSEGLVLTREEAYAQLESNYFPSPGDVVFFSDPADFPDLDGMSLENIWGPDVDVVANLYSQGWGQDGQTEAIISIARCDSHGQDVYYWYGVLLGRFE